jgi:methyl-accepting chemotaxis protein
MDYTTPLTATFEMQRQSIKQGQRALEQSLSVQQSVNEAVLDGMESTESAQRRTVELSQSTFGKTLDAVAANVPGTEPLVEEARRAVDEQFDMLLENHAEVFDSITAEYEEGTDAYDEMMDDYVAALDEQLELLFEAHEQVEDQSVEAVDQLSEQFDEMQAQVEEVQEQVQDVQEQAAEAVEV